MKILLFFLSPLFLSAQMNRAQGEVFKHRPERPYQDVKKTGLVVVTKGMYGLIFEDKNLSLEVRKKVQIFFNHRYNGYTELKTYELRVEDTPKGWRIEGYLIQ